MNSISHLRRQNIGIDWDCVRAVQLEQGIGGKATLESFRNRWIKQFGKPSSINDERFLKQGILSYYEDYLCCTDSLANYIGSV